LSGMVFIRCRRSFLLRGLMIPRQQDFFGGLKLLQSVRAHQWMYRFHQQQHHWTSFDLYQTSHSALLSFRHRRISTAPKRLPILCQLLIYLRPALRENPRMRMGGFRLVSDNEVLPTTASSLRLGSRRCQCEHSLPSYRRFSPFATSSDRRVRLDLADAWDGTNVTDVAKGLNMERETPAMWPSA